MIQTTVRMASMGRASFARSSSVERAVLGAALLALAHAFACSSNGPTTVAGDAAAAHADGGDDALACAVQAWQYDQSCAADSDCVLVNEVLTCPPTICSFCMTGVINKEAEDAYVAAFAAATVGVDPKTPPCNCPDIGFPCCRSGKCSRFCQ